jgi:peroxiredoxin Q/BCP
MSKHSEHTPQTDQGEPFQLKAFLRDAGKSYGILFFYPKDMTSGCTQEACDFQTSLKRAQTMDAAVLGISKDSVESHQKFKKKEGLTYTLVSDPSLELIQGFGVWKEKSMYGRKYMGVERSTFIVDKNGNVLREFRGVKVKDHVKDVLAALAEIRDAS